MNPLGRKPPTDFVHVERYPLTLATTPAKPVPVTIGVNWYENFDRPVTDSRGRWWVGRGDLGRIRGGHCVCIPPESIKDSTGWHEFYDQGREGACVGFGSSRMMSLLNRKRYDARWLWNRAKEVDEWPDTNPGDDQGTSVRAAMDILRTQGHVRVGGKGIGRPVELSQGIEANRWAITVQSVLEALQSPSYEKTRPTPFPSYREAGAVPFLNSWGRAYPRVTWMPLETLGRLLAEDGEATLVTDR